MYNKIHKTNNKTYAELLFKNTSNKKNKKQISKTYNK